MPAVPRLLALGLFGLSGTLGASAGATEPPGETSTSPGDAQQEYTVAPEVAPSALRAPATSPTEPLLRSDPPPEFTPPLVEALSLMTVMRLTEALLWPEPFARTDLGFWGRRYREAYTEPPLFDASKPAFRWDGDGYVVNLVGHGLFGSELYLRARRCHFGVVGSLLFAASASTFWEYVVEANGTRPSAQDLVYTPLAGLLFGEARYQGARALVGPGTARAIFRTLLDPMGEFTEALGACPLEGPAP